MLLSLPFSDICGHQYIDISSSETVNLASPNYPTYYPINLNCTWLISTDDGALPLVKFIDFNLQPFSDLLRFGNLRMHYYTVTGNQAPHFVVMNNSVARITFETHIWNFDSIGFWLEISSTSVNSKYH